MRVTISYAIVVVLGGFVANQSASAQKKYAGKLFDPLPANVGEIDPDGPVPFSATNPDVPKTTTDSQPEIEIKVMFPKGTPVPDDFRHAIDGVPNSQFSPEHIRQFSLGSAGKDLIELARKTDAVSRIELLRPRMNAPVTIAPFNAAARKTHNVDEFTASFDIPFQLGRSVRAAVFDGGKIRDTHQEFLLPNSTSRVTLHGSVTIPGFSRHATHVAGTMAARGDPQSLARGMAPGLRLTSFDWVNDLNNLSSIAAGFQVSNHSYGPATGWGFDREAGVYRWWGDQSISENEDADFGKYKADNHQLDSILNLNKAITTFVAAGNDRDNQPPAQPWPHYAIVRNPVTGQLEWQLSLKVRDPDGLDQGGIDTISGLGVSKNCVTIGAIHDAVNQGDALTTTPFSSWGPTDDGRIKPDLVANGHILLSTASASNSSYVQLSGTSMASPTAAAIGARLAEHFNVEKGRFPLSCELKAIMIHSAKETGSTPGPDPEFGWGSIDAEAAGRVIASSDGQMVMLKQIDHGNTETIKLNRSSQAEGRIRVTMVWTDPPGTPSVGGLNDATLTLMNNIDMELKAPDNVPFHPYSLNRADPTGQATTSGANLRDNVEMIEAPPHTGKWELIVRAANFKAGTTQEYALIISGFELVQD